jgi:hypothetical protein
MAHFSPHRGKFYIRGPGVSSTARCHPALSEGGTSIVTVLVNTPCSLQRNIGTPCKKFARCRSNVMLSTHPSFRFLTRVLALGFAVASTLHAADAPAEHLLNVLLSPETSDKEWQFAADSFQQLPADVAIRALYPELAKGIPGGMSYAAYNCNDPHRDRHLEAWGRFCVVNWLWCHTVCCSKAQPLIGKTLLELWAHPLSAYGQGVLLSTVDSCAWVPDAERPVYSLFMDSAAAAGLRMQAAACLLHHFGIKYHREVVSFALFGPRDKRDFLFRELANPSHARVSGIDPAVVRLGFWLLLEEMALHEDRFAHRTVGNSSYGEFLFANLLGTYLGQPFAPDYKLPKYQKGEEGKEIWYRETAENAFNWWLLNRDRYAN